MSNPINRKTYKTHLHSAVTWRHPQSDDFLDRDEAAGGGCAIPPAGLDRGPAKGGALFDLGETLSDGRREILPPSVAGSDVIHIHVGAESSHEQND